MDYFDCSTIGCDPTGKVLEANTGIPQPAQGTVIPSVVEEKRKQIQSGTELSITVWKDSMGVIYIQDGQHRFVASCIEGKKIKLNWKKFGYAAFRNGWGATKHEKVTPAKERIKSK
ncbi:hypothetical protein [Serratia quinivorans]|uniref:hypothetical protein n=1 Tax=Serratia quinivorans TaxID=137545 RepID=UPI002E772E5B|nr:hypothetical protein [Serratia quinivorans]